MKKANTHIDFANDKVTMFGNQQDLLTTSSGHYAVSISERACIDRLDESDTETTLIAKTVNMADKMKVARKLHSQFPHPSTDKLLKLINNAGLVDDKELKEAIIEIYQTCEICKVYRKPGYKPVVSVSLAEEFNEVVAMDLKFIESNIILHLIDHVTRFSAAAIVKSKEREEIVKHLFRSWISIFGAPSKFFSDNGREFSNDNYNAMGEAYNITIKKTAAESPFSNGLAERHNAVLEEMLLKTCEDTGASVEVALQWVINAKN